MVPEMEEFCCSGNKENFRKFDDDIKKFVLIKRGDCKFTKKILNAQLRGADMVIVYDNKKTSKPNVVMANDGHGHLIDIPSIFISNKDGEQILTTFKNCNNSLIFKISFDVFVSDRANLTFWLDVNNRESFVSIRDFFRDYYDVIDDYLDIDLRYKLNLLRFKINKNCGKEECD